ncbi:Regulatory protein BlaR1 [Posidoniimonas polymericola]|uniref:Regulatory protein BlaR1 n=1 Tax=Posidoniimonas polymericola TaxID=2528002 RepID=A0A5C5YT34_9BACT|nr:M56 family metallopeptidase [Posidoniimonas polymericola]TWT77817.1 Regulatory protein BlaR1 [Posidoniimonas polymericola]
MNSGALWLIAGWTMLHFLWVGSTIALITLVARFTLRTAAPLARYTVTLMGFGALAIAPALIAGYLWQQEPIAIPGSPLAGAPAATFEFAALATEASESTIDLAETPLAFDPQAAEFQPSTATTAAEPATLPATAAEPTALNNVALDEKLVAVFDQAAEWLPLLWLIGAPLTFLLLATGLIGVERLRKDCQPVTSGPLHEALVAAAERLRIRGRAALALSERVAQPMLIGVLRPVVLLPAIAASGYSPEQLEMVLLHELAHVRRRDNLVNLLQRAIESLLFFHPAVWLVSRQLRADREQCCDALVVRLTDDPQSYAELLVAVAEQTSSGPLPLAASAMASHPLARRVRRILQLEDEPMLVSKKFLLAVVAVGLGLTGACGYSFSQGPEAVSEAANEPEASPDETQSAEPQEVEAETPDEEPAPGNPHSLSLEDQRVADLAFKMFDIEVASLDDAQAPAVKEKGFGGGLVVTKGTFGNRGGGRGGVPPVFAPSDILVGLHVWPIEGWDQLAEVLRRDDLGEFNPLKVYVLRWSPVTPSNDGFGRGGGNGGEMGGGYGGEFGGGGYGEMGGQAHEPEMTYKLVTGRITFKADAWEAEQERLGKTVKYKLPPTPAKKPGPPSLPPPGFGPPPAATAPSTDETYFKAPPLVLPGDRVERSAAQLPEPGSTPPPLAKLTYNGRSFEEWNTQWRTELSTKERTTAIQALTAFGRAGYEIEAANAILDVAAVYDFSERRLGSIQGAIADALLSTSQPPSPNAAPLEAWFPLLMDRYETDPERYASLVQEMVQRISRSLTPVEVDKSTYETICGLLDDPHTEVATAALKTLVSKDERLADPRVRDTWISALQSDDLKVRRGALMLLHLPGNMGRTWTPLTNENVDEQWLRLLYQNLLHEDFSVRRLSRLLLGGASDHAKLQTADFLKQVLESPTESELHCDLYPASGAAEIAAAKLAAARGIAVLGPAAGASKPPLEGLLESDDIKLAWAAAVAMDTIDNSRIDGSTFESYRRTIGAEGQLSPENGADERSWLQNNAGRVGSYLRGRIEEEANRINHRYSDAHKAIWVSWQESLIGQKHSEQQ